MIDPTVQFLSLDTIDFWARQVLEDFQPDALCRPEPVDARGLVEFYLPRQGGRFEVGTAEEMGAFEGLTQFDAEGPLVMLRADQWEALLGGGEPSLRARATIAHELGHVMLHADYARQHAEYTTLLAEAGVDALSVTTIPGEADLEWQAWAFAGCLMMPIEMVCNLEDFRPRSVARVFDVSPQFARRHLLRLRNQGLV